MPKSKAAMDAYQRAWQQIVRPPRFGYSAEMDFDCWLPDEVGGVGVSKTEVPFVASDGKTELSASLISPAGSPPSTLLVYLHTYSGNKLEGKFLVQRVLPRAGLVLFDSFGCGNAGGDLVTLGVRESDDLSRLLAKLHALTRFSTLLLYGRSMGAVTALHYLSRFHCFPMAKSARPEPPPAFEVAAAALDSPFPDLHRLVKGRLIAAGRSAWLASLMLVPVSMSLRSALGIDLFELNRPVDLVARVRTPALFFLGELDELVDHSEFRRMFQLYGTRNKRLDIVAGLTHAGQRSETTISNAVSFLMEAIDSARHCSLTELPISPPAAPSNRSASLPDFPPSDPTPSPPPVARPHKRSKSSHIKPKAAVVPRIRSISPRRSAKNELNPKIL